jgi:uncharacterized protein YfaP (DUF2135 family)
VARCIGPQAARGAARRACRPVWRAVALATLLLTGWFGPARVDGQGLDEQATLEVVQPEVQWSVAGATAWETVAALQVVRYGDRVRTGPGAAARLVYFEGTVTELGEFTGLLVLRLERTESGNIVTRLFQSIGTTVNRVVQLADPAARFEVESPTSLAIVRGTTPRLQVAVDGTTRVANLPDGSGGLVEVVGTIPGSPSVTLAEGEETEVLPGQAPLPPAPIGTLPPFDFDRGGAGGVIPEVPLPSAPPAPLEPPPGPVVPPPGPGQPPIPPPRPPPTPPAVRPPITPTLPPSGSAVEGVVRNAANGRPLPGATVRVVGGSQTTTDASGRYRLANLPPGTASLTVAASGFVSDRADVTVPASGVQTQTFALSPALAEGQWRVVLTWGNSPRDLDAHLWVSSQPTGATTGASAPARTEIYYGNRGSLTARPFVALDVDDTSGLGPETITVGQPVPGSFTYAVYQYSADGTLAASGARVQILRGDRVTHTFTVPAGAGRWWHVFTADGATGQITTVNRLSDSSPIR